jgi:hypothetical protein
VGARVGAAIWCGGVSPQRHVGVHVEVGGGVGARVGAAGRGRRGPERHVGVEVGGRAPARVVAGGARGPGDSRRLALVGVVGVDAGEHGVEPRVPPLLTQHNLVESTPDEVGGSGGARFARGRRHQAEVGGARVEAGCSGRHQGEVAHGGAGTQVGIRGGEGVEGRRKQLGQAPQLPRHRAIRAVEVFPVAAA